MLNNYSGGFCNFFLQYGTYFPRIRTTDLRMRIRIQFKILILLFSSVAEKMLTKNKFCLQNICLLLFEGTFTSAFKDKKSQNCRNLGFSYFFACRWKDQDQDQDPDPGSEIQGGPKTKGSNGSESVRF
jgi:hypothetical protein